MKKEFYQIEEILNYLTKNFEFNTFTRYTNIQSEQSSEVVGKNFLDKYKGGDCLNFGKALIELSGNENLKIIGALPQLEKCSVSQADFMQYGHTAIILDTGSKLYLAEPTMRLNKLIPIKNNSSIENCEQIYSINNVTSKGFTLLTKTKSKYNVNTKNDFLFEPLPSDLLNDLAKKYRLLKRNLHVVNRVVNNAPRYYLKYEVALNSYKSNIPEVPDELKIEELSNYNKIWESVFLIQNFGEYIQTLMSNYQTYIQEFVY